MAKKFVELGTSNEDTHYTLRRPDVTLQDKIKKEIYIVGIEC